MQRRKDVKVTAYSSTGISDFLIQILSAVTFLLRCKINVVRPQTDFLFVHPRNKFNPHIAKLVFFLYLFCRVKPLPQHHRTHAAFTRPASTGSPYRNHRRNSTNGAYTINDTQHPPTSGGTAGTQPAAAEVSQLGGGHEHHHGGTGPPDDHGAAAAGPGTVGSLHAGVGRPHSRVHESDKRGTHNHGEAQQVTQPQTGDTTGSHGTTRGHNSTGATNVDNSGTREAATPTINGETDTSAKDVDHPAARNARQPAANTKHHHRDNNTGHAQRPPAPEQAADAGLQGQTDVPTTPPGKTGVNSNPRPVTTRACDTRPHRGHGAGGDKHFRNNRNRGKPNSRSPSNRGYGNIPGRGGGPVR
ncbi:filaggrin-2-like [Metopolophium dirhodum]|uniref:filaggrin-2-like n=1 Tax=Metopolophium dirhodum TaxID=44670 RepID=UPI00298FDE47|nr:filaggrin-2-like [Metopolophium dirhodum]